MPDGLASLFTAAGAVTVALAVVLAVLLGVYCWRVGRQRLLSRINLLFAVLVAWNMVALITGSLMAAR